MNKEQLAKVRDALENFAVWGLRDEAIAILDAALAAEPQQPVAWRDKSALPGYPSYEYNRQGIGEPLYTAPVAAPQQPVVWTSIKDAMPKSGVTVLACYKNSHGNLRRIRAEWTAAKTVESNSDYDFGEYDEETDAYWSPEGWYECIDNWDEYSSVMVSEGEVTHWMPLPLAPDDPLYTAPVAAPDDATDWEGIAADQAMTIAMLRVEYQQLQALVTSQGIALMEQEEWQKDAERYRWLRDHASRDWLDAGITDDAVDVAINDKSQWRRKP